jgi:hypothetical protein
MTKWCELRWSEDEDYDGWLTDHLCEKPLNHSGDHECQCGATTVELTV